MRIFCLIAISFSGLLAVLCVIALPFWLMGVPGVENSYAKGWKLGLYVVLLYPAAWLCVSAYWLIARKQITAEHLSIWNASIGSGSLVILAIASGVMFYAFKVMSRT